MAEAAGLSAAIDYLREIGMEEIHAYEHELVEYALAQLKEVEGLRLLGPASADGRGGALSFTLTGLDGREIHPHDVSQVLDAHGIAVRAGHHCARPLHRRFGIAASTRASVYLYTTRGEIDALADGLRQTQKFFGTV